MKKVNTISKSVADEIAKNYFENSEAKSLYITRDGQIFLKGSENYMSMHERDCQLEKSWPYSRDEDIVVEEPIKKSKKKNIGTMSFKALQDYAIELTDKEILKIEDWENLDYKELKTFLKDK